MVVVELVQVGVGVVLLAQEHKVPLHQQMVEMVGMVLH
jgi:hypothetical protein